MRTPAQIEAARRNGARSQGPVTEQGKSRSRQNAIQHGLRSHKLVVIEGEDPHQWSTLLQACVDEFQPQSSVEHELVVEIASARWRLRRSWSVETAMIDMEIEKQRSAIEEQFELADVPLRHASAFIGLGHNLHLLDRYETRMRRSYDRSVKNLYDLRDRRNASRRAGILPNEPEPVLTDPQRD